MASEEILKARFQLMTQELAGSTLVLLNDEGTILTWNKGARGLSGYTAGEIIGQHISMFYLPEDRQKGLPQRTLEEARAKGKATYVGRRLRKNGTIFYGAIEIVAIKDDNGGVIGFTKQARELKDENESWSFLFDDHGVLHLKVNEISNTPEKITEFRKLLTNRFDPTAKICCIADLRDANITDEGMSFSRQNVSKLYKAIAYITDPLVDPMTEKVTAAISEEIPVAVFTTREAAKEWVGRYL